jgi:hypothetical protein
MSRRANTLIGITSLCAVIFALAVGAGPASAARTLAGKLNGYNSAASAAVDAGDNVWITDSGQASKTNPGPNGLYKYDPFPSLNLIATPNTFEPFGHFSLALQMAVDNATGELFVAQSNGRAVYIFAPKGGAAQCKEEVGEPVCYTHAWTRINSASTYTNPKIEVAIDNTDTYSKGRVYLSLNSPENDVEALDREQRAVDFPAAASYITNNRLTGTPSGRFGEVGYVSVDSAGNLYVTDWVKKVVDEFDSTGTFIRSFPAPRAHPGYFTEGNGGAAVDPTNGHLLISEGSYDSETGAGAVKEFDESANFLGTDRVNSGEFYAIGQPVVNASGYAYIPSSDTVTIFNPAPTEPVVTYRQVSSPTATGGTLEGTVDPNGGGQVTECEFEYVAESEYQEGAVDPYASGQTVACGPAAPFGATTDVSAPVAGLTTGESYRYRIVVHNSNGVKYGTNETYTPQEVLGLTTEAASEVEEDAATLNASFLGNGEATQYDFEWGRTEAYGTTTTTASVSPPNAAREPLSASLEGLEPYSTYHFRVVAMNAAGTSHGEDEVFTTPPGVPSVTGESVTIVHSDRAVLHGKVDPNGAVTKVHFEYVPDDEFSTSGFQNALETQPEKPIGMSKHSQEVTVPITKLEPGTLYHYRAVGVNEAGIGVPSTPHTFTTFAFTREVTDGCPNAHVRQQTSSSLLLDCRAYELVSARNSGGYDVESSLVAGEKPFANYADAQAPGGDPRVLYGVHNGGIPGTGNSTNRGIDPYVATRGEDGWSTKYVGIPADGTPSTVPFSSSFIGADSSLGTLAFGGDEICSPCFPDGSTGNPIHTPTAALVQGMAGSIPHPNATAAGFIGSPLSADGSHFVFGSTSQFETDGNNNGDVSIYDRNLNTGQTHVVSKTTGGATMTGPGIGELAISANGSRIVVGQLVSETGNAKHWHLYMNIGDSGKTVDLTPGATSGALFDGMTEDGSKVFFTTADALTTSSDQDTDGSADLYQAAVGPTGTVTLSRVSTGAEGTGNSDSCQPDANTVHEHWNTAGSEEDCGVVAIGGGQGLAKEAGTVYFLSPEKLDGSANGVEDAPNLYVARPGNPPAFVATLESSGNAPLPPSSHPFVRSFGAFSNPTGVAIDPVTGGIYVLDVGNNIGQGFVYKFTADGRSDLSFGQNGKITVSGVIGLYNFPTQIAVDVDPASPNYRDLYVPEFLGKLKKFSPSGEQLATLETFESGTSGVAVNPANGDVYVTSYFFNAGLKYNAAGELLGFFPLETHSPEPESIAVSGAGEVYVANGGGTLARKGTTEVYDEAGTWLRTLDENPSYGVAVDPVDEHVYVDDGSEVLEFEPSGATIGSPTGAGRLSHSISLAAEGGTLVIDNPGQTDVEAYGPSVLPRDVQTDNPVVVDSVSEPGSAKTGDFQVTPSGDDAAFTSTLSLTGYDNGVIHPEVFRYDSGSGVECASCNPTSEQAIGDASLPRHGLGLSDDGRVFFNSTEGLVDRDLNEKEDAYQWEPKAFELGQDAPPCARDGGCVELLSTGTSPFAAELLGISSAGGDAYFFTRDKLAEEDENGNTVKIYDARSFGGFPFVPTPPQCKASDECHGPGSPAPPAPQIKSYAPTPGGNLPPCKRGFVRRHGDCVRRTGKRRRHGHRHRHRKSHRGKPHRSEGR